MSVSMISKLAAYISQKTFYVAICPHQKDGLLFMPQKDLDYSLTVRQKFGFYQGIYKLYLYIPITSADFLSKLEIPKSEIEEEENKGK